jgi:UDP-glucose 4-epimerase
MKKILVTGGTGYIGSHTVVELQLSGFEVTIVDSLEKSHEEVIGRIEKITGRIPAFYQADLRLPGELENILAEESSFDGVIHFAAYKAVGESMEKPLEYYNNNLISLLNLLNAMRGANIRRLVFSSSCAIYGNTEILPVKEDMPTGVPTSPYGNSKKMCEEIIRDSAAKCNILSIALRYFNPVGAHESALIGEWPIGLPGNLLPYITQVAAGKRKELAVFGNDYPTPDGSCIRDYIHVCDVARAHVLALERLLKESKPSFGMEVYNLGTGEGHSVLEIIAAFEQYTGVKIPYNIKERRPGDVAAVFADPSLAGKVLNWQARETLQSMMESAWRWEQTL